MLGKALFWDLQTGGDGRTACATCHFHAGVDGRVLNTVNPGRDGVFQIVSGPDETLTAAVFPFGGDPAIDDMPDAGDQRSEGPVGADAELPIGEPKSW